MIFTFKDYQQQKRSRFMDFALFLFTGLIGALLLFLWFGTHHTTTVNNLNVLWAFLPNLIVAFYLIKRNPPKWVRVYTRFLVILSLTDLVSSKKASTSLWVQGRSLHWYFKASLIAKLVAMDTRR